MKTLLKSKEHTQTIIHALRQYRQQYINHTKTVIEIKGISPKDINLILDMNQKVIDECNAVLDAIGTD